MKDSVLYLLGSALIPVLSTDVSAGAASNVHLGLVAVLAVGAFPNVLAVLVRDDFYLSVVAAYLAVVALGIELCVHYVIINKFHNAENCIKVVLHIGNFNVGDCATGRESLELRLKRKLLKRVDRLGNVNVIRVGDIVSVGYALYDAKAVLKTFSKLVGRALKRSTVDGVVDIFCFLPLLRIHVELAHNLKTELLALGLCELLLDKGIYALPKTCVSERNGGITAVKVFVDGLALLKSGESTVLPKDRRGVGESA